MFSLRFSGLTECVCVWVWFLFCRKLGHVSCFCCCLRWRVLCWVLIGKYGNTLFSLCIPIIIVKTVWILIINFVTVIAIFRHEFIIARHGAFSLKKKRVFSFFSFSTRPRARLLIYDYETLFLDFLIKSRLAYWTGFGQVFILQE